MTKLLLSIVLSVFTTQVFGSDNTLYEETIHNKPALGEETEVYLGDRMLAQAMGEWKECITPRRTYSKTSFGWTGIYKAGEPICKRELKSKHYFPTYVNATGHGNTTTQSVSWKGRKGKYKLCQTSAGLTAYCIKNLSEDDVEAGETFIYTNNSIQQTLEYAGRSDQVLRFVYAEFINGYARQAFSREFQVDLSEGNIAAYKGAIIEIIDATNVQIKYKVIRNFSSDL